MALLKELLILAGYLSSLVAILTGIWKTLVSISHQIQRRLDLRESRVQARQQAAVEKARAEGLAEGYSHWKMFVFAALLIIIFYYAYAAGKSGAAQA
jgi:hypothetical protein